MTAEEKKVAALARIAGDLSNLNTTKFELVAHALLREVEGIPFAHRGLSANQNPAGYTVDSLSLGGSVVGEYGTEGDYFTTPFDKIKRDVKHALGVSSLVQRIYLMSNQPCRNIDLPRAQQAAADAATACAGGAAASGKAAPDPAPERILVWSQREIASELYDRFVVPGKEAVATLAAHLPEFARLLDEEAYELAIPRLPADYVRDDKNFDDLTQALSEHEALQLAGVSGAGKTLLAADWVRHVRETKTSVIWLQRDELPAGYNLRGVRAERFGVRLNLAKRLSEPRTLLVVDDFQGEPQQLIAAWREHAGPGGLLLLTCQSASSLAPSLKVFGVERSTARSILPQPISDAAFQRIYAACGGVPRALTLCRSLVACGVVPTADALVEVVRDLPVGDAGGSMLLWQALLSRHLPAVSQELGLLQWFGSQRLDETFLVETIGAIGLAKLQERALLQSEGSTIWKVHDLIWQCLPHLDLKDVSSRGMDLLGGYITKHSATKVRHVRLTLSLLDAKIAALRPAPPAPGLWAYAYLQLDRCEETPEFIDALAAGPPPGGNDWAVWAAWIEAKERLSRTPRAQEGFLEAAAEELEAACARTTNSRAAAALAHHAGKFHARLRRFVEAERCYRAALERDLAYPEVVLAQARAARNTRDFDRGAKLIGQLLEAMNENGISTGLAAYGELVNYPALLKKWVIDDVDHFMAFVASARIEGFGQHDQTLRAVCRGLEYSAPELVVRLLSSSDPPTFEELRSESERERAGWAEHYLLYASCLQKTGGISAQSAATACLLFCAFRAS